VAGEAAPVAIAKNMASTHLILYRTKKSLIWFFLYYVPVHCTYMQQNTQSHIWI